MSAAEAGSSESIVAARRLGESVLAPAAQATDQAPVVPRDHLEALAVVGLCGLAGPVDHGGEAAPPAVVREVYEVLAGACGVTFFVWVQHHAPVRLLARSSNREQRDRWLGALCAGSVLGGVAFAYLRRPGPPAVVARPVPGGYSVSGEAPWVTSWGLARLFAVAAVVEGDAEGGGEEVVFFLFDAEAGSGTSVRASPPLRLAAMGASATVRLGFDGLFVAEADVVSRVGLEAWRARDRVATSRPHPAAFGLAATAVELLARRAVERGQPAVGEAAEALGAELQACRTWAYRLSDETPADPGSVDQARLADLVEARAWGLDVAMRSAQALVAATGGGAMALDHPAQRLLREAGFWSIQAQSASLRAATLMRVSVRRSPRSR